MEISLEGCGMEEHWEDRLKLFLMVRGIVFLGVSIAKNSMSRSLRLILETNWLFFIPNLQYISHWGILFLLPNSMNSLNNPWPNVRKHQINCSKSKATYGFPKDRRFRSTSKILYHITNPDAIRSITYHPGSATRVLRVSGISVKGLAIPDPARLLLDSIFSSLTPT